MVPSRNESSVATKRTIEEAKASSSDAEAKGPFGGFVEQPKVNGMHFLQPPPEVVHNQLSSDVEGYRAHAIADGIPFRCASLAWKLPYLDESWPGIGKVQQSTRACPGMPAYAAALLVC